MFLILILTLFKKLFSEYITIRQNAHLYVLASGLKLVIAEG
jgi:hypothetical protein